MRTTWMTAVALIVVAVLSPSALAGLNDPISFSQAGTVTLTLDESAGGFDHVLELSAALGPIGTPLMALTDVGAPSSDVLGYVPAIIGDTASVGSFAAGEEIVFRLTNVESLRLGTPGTIGDQIFSGSASSLNPGPSDYYTYVDFLDATTIKVYFEDVFGIPATDPDPVTAFLTGGYDVAFTLSLNVVPEPAALTLLGISALGLLVRRN